MFSLSKLLSNIVKFSSVATTQYQLVKIASTLANITDTNITFNNKALEQSFSKYIDALMKLDDILSGKNIENEDTSKEEYLMEIIESIDFWSKKIKHYAVNMKHDWLSEDVTEEELAEFMVNANEAIDKSLETYSGLNTNDLLEQFKSDQKNEEQDIPGAGIDYADKIKGNLHFTGNLAESRLRANQKYMNKLKFLRKVNPQAPEWLSYQESVKRTAEKRRNLLNSDPVLRTKWKELQNKKYKQRRSLVDKKIEDLKKDLERYKREGANYNTEKLIQRTEGLLKQLSSKFILTEKAKEHQEVIKDRVLDKTESMMGCLRRITLKLQGNKNHIKNKIRDKYKVQWKDKFEAAGNNMEEINKIKKQIDEELVKDPMLLNHVNIMKLIQNYTLIVKSVNMRRGDGVKPETVSIAVNAVGIGQNLIPKLTENYPAIAEEIKTCNNIMMKQVKALLNVSETSNVSEENINKEELPPQTVYQPQQFEEEEEDAPDTIKEPFMNEAIAKRMEKLKKLADKHFNSIDDLLDDSLSIIDKLDFNIDLES